MVLLGVALVLAAMWLAAILTDRQVGKRMAVKYAEHYQQYHTVEYPSIPPPESRL